MAADTEPVASVDAATLARDHTRVNKKEDAMRNRIIVIGAIAVLAYVLGSRAGRVQVKSRESVGHQLVRLWDDPRSRRRRRKAAAKAEKKAKKALREFRR